MNLMHGDCLELMAQIPDGSVGMVLTDPPYEISNSGGGMMADRLALALEQHALMPLHDAVWSCDRHPDFDAARLHWRIVPELPIVARRLFVARFRELVAIGAQTQESVTDWSAA